MRCLLMATEVERAREGFFASRLETDVGFGLRGFAEFGAEGEYKVFERLIKKGKAMGVEMKSNSEVDREHPMPGRTGWVNKNKRKEQVAYLCFFFEEL